MVDLSTQKLKNNYFGLEDSLVDSLGTFWLGTAVSHSPLA